MTDTGIALGLATIAVLFWQLRIIAPAKEGSGFVTSADLFTQIYPMWYRAADWMRAGTLPLWNPYQGCGHPFLATLQYGVLYPLNFPVLLLRTEVAIEAITVLHLILACWFMYVYARAIRLHRAAAVAASITFMLSGFVVGQTTWFTPALAAAVWLPLALAAVERIATRPCFSWAAVLAAAIAMSFLSGFVQTWVYSMYVIVAYGMLRTAILAARRGVGSQPMRVATLLTLGVILGISLAAVQLLPSLELQRLSPRRPGGLSLAQLLPFGPSPLRQVLMQAVNATGDTPYLGVIALLLFPLSWFTMSGRWRVVLLWCCAVGSFAAALKLSPALLVVYHALPAMTWFRLPQRMLFLYAFAGATLTGIALDAALRIGERPWKKRAAVLTIVGTAAILGSSFASDLSRQSWLYLVSGSILLCGIVVPRQRLLRRACVLGLLSTIALDLFHAPVPSYSRPYHGTARLDSERQAFDFIHTHQGFARTYIHAPGLLALDWSITAKQGTLRQIYAVTDYEPLSLDRLARFASLFQRAALAGTDPIPFEGELVADPADPHFRLLDLMSVRFVLINTADTGLQQPLLRAGWRLVFASHDGHYAVYETPDPFPRAYIAYDVVEVPDEATALRTVSEPSFDPRKTVVIEAPQVTAPAAPEPVAAGIMPARIVTYDSTRAVIETDSSQAGYLVLTDSFYPGWHASIDGKPVEIVRANYLFRAVAMPPGRHRVQFVYNPTSFRIGVAVTLAAACALTLPAILKRRKSAATAAGGSSGAVHLN